LKCCCLELDTAATPKNEVATDTKGYAELKIRQPDVAEWLNRIEKPDHGHNDQHQDHRPDDDGHDAVDKSARSSLYRARGLIADNVDRFDDRISGLSGPIPAEDLAGQMRCWRVCSQRGIAQR